MWPVKRELPNNLWFHSMWPKKIYFPPPPPPYRVISGTGEMDLKYQSMPLHDDHHPAPPPPPPYLLLDVREKDDYEQAHIITGKNTGYYILFVSPLPLSLSPLQHHPLYSTSHSKALPCCHAFQIMQLLL